MVKSNFSEKHKRSIYVYFDYNNKSYGMLNLPEGRVLLCNEKYISDFFPDNESFAEFIQNYSVDGVSLKEIFDNGLYGDTLDIF